MTAEALSVEEDMHRCMVRQLLRWRVERGNQYVLDWLADPKVKPRRERLYDDCKAQWDRGNRGKQGDWREA